MRAPEHSLGYATNEGGVPLSPQAYRYMVKLVKKDGSRIELEDCGEQIEDIRNACRKVAEHDMPEELRDWYELYRANERLHELERAEAYEHAALQRDRIRAKEDFPDLGPRLRANVHSHYAKLFDAMPGIGEGTVRVCRFLDCLLPTAVATPDGIVRINENFVKALHYIAERGGKGESGRIDAYPAYGGSKTLGELYSSLVFSVAIRTVRGGFRVDEWGLATFQTDERLARGERGRLHALVNLLAQYFYWIVFVELHKYPEQRVRELIREDPKPFRGITAQQRENFPVHLRKACIQLIRSGGMPFVGKWEYVPTGVTERNVEAFLAGCSGEAFD